jgi:hypothetical protein
MECQQSNGVFHNRVRNLKCGAELLGRALLWILKWVLAVVAWGVLIFVAFCVSWGGTGVVSLPPVQDSVSLMMFISIVVMGMFWSLWKLAGTNEALVILAFVFTLMCVWHFVF